MEERRGEETSGSELWWRYYSGGLPVRDNITRASVLASLRILGADFAWNTCGFRHVAHSLHFICIPQIQKCLPELIFLYPLLGESCLRTNRIPGICTFQPVIFFPQQSLVFWPAHSFYCAFLRTLSILFHHPPEPSDHIRTYESQIPSPIFKGPVN
jgi:hypothetical protein